MPEVVLLLVRQLFRFQIGDINSENITVENQVVSKFCADSSEMEENVSDIGAKIVRTTRKLGRPPKGTSKSRKTAKAALSKSHNEGLFSFLECQRTGKPQNCGDVVYFT